MKKCLDHATGRNINSLGRRIRSVALRYCGPLDRESGSLSTMLHRYRGNWRGFGSASHLPGGVGGEILVADGPFARSKQIARTEAILFLAREPLPSRKLAQLADLTDGTKARTLVRELNRLYDSQGCAFRVVEIAGGFQLMSRPQFSPWLRRLHSAASEVRLSGPALETLAVVAYRQPVLRAAVEAIRGVQCGEILRQLMERDLVKIVGRSEDLGRPFLYGTTKQFLQVFGLRAIDELPRQEWFEDAELEASVESLETSEEPVSNQLEEE